MSALEQMLESKLKPLFEKLLKQFKPQIDAYLKHQEDQVRLLQHVSDQVDYIRLKLEENDVPPVTVVVDEPVVSVERPNGQDIEGPLK